MKIWAKTEEFSEGKYLVVRRDGTIPPWPHFVMSGDDHAVPAGLRAYADMAEQLGYEADYVASIRELSEDFARRDPSPISDPDAPPHRTDNPMVIGMMRGGGDLSSASEAGFLNNLATIVFADNVRMGWYSDPATGERVKRNVGEMLALIHSEVSEALEGHRKNLKDDHLPERPMIEVELADVLIRVFDLAGYLGLDVGGAYTAKRAYNSKRQDHKLETRAKEGGKAF